MEGLRSLLPGATATATATAPLPEPVTVTVARVVRSDRREAFERWAEHALSLAAPFPGNLVSTLLHPGQASSGYHLVYRFTDDEPLAARERPPQRREVVAPAAGVEGEARVGRG